MMASQPYKVKGYDVTMTTALPSKYKIALYWSTSNPVLCIDIGEPSCFACGFYRKQWDEPRTLAARWEKATLDRAHIVGVSQGGSNKASNVVLLCGRCHEESPMTRNPETMVAWIRRRKSHTQYLQELILEELSAIDTRDIRFDLTPEEKDLVLRRLKEKVDQGDLGYHCTRTSILSMSTLVIGVTDILRDLGSMESPPSGKPHMK